MKSIFNISCTIAVSDFTDTGCNPSFGAHQWKNIVSIVNICIGIAIGKFRIISSHANQSTNVNIANDSS